MAKIKILVVEDERIVAEDIKSTLQNLGYEVCSITSKGEEAIALAGEKRPELVLMDIMLASHMDGTEAAQAIYKNYDIPVVFLSAFADTHVLKKAKVSNPFGYIIKPFTDRELYSAIEIAYNKNQLQKKITHLNNVLKAIRNVNQLIVREKDKKKLLKGVCDNLIETRGYYNVWIALLDQSGRCEYIEQAGIEKRTNLLLSLLQKGKLTGCISLALARPGIHVIHDMKNECKECPFSEIYEGRKGLVIALRHNNIVYGVMNVLTRSEYIESEEEFSLLEEVVGDIAYALYNIEMEAKKEKAGKELRESEFRFHNLIEQSGDAIYLLYEGKFEIINARFTKIFGYTVEETNAPGFSFFKLVSPKSLTMVKDHTLKVSKGEKLNSIYEFVALDKTGNEIDCEVSVTSIKYKNGMAIQGIIRDIRERKLSERRRELISEILAILNRQNEWKKLIADILEKLKQFTGFEALAIRLKDKDDYPYIESNGFSKHFIEEGKSLLTRDDNGEIIYEINGSPKLDRLCEYIINGRTALFPGYFTQGGSFWTNSTSELLAGRSSEMIRIIERDGYNKEGYESVALIPLRSGNNVIGIMHLVDKRTGMFDLDMIEYFEEIGATIGIAFKRMEAEKKIIESEARFRNIYENSTIGIYQSTFDGMLIMANPAFIAMFGYSDFDDIFSKNANEFYVDEKEQEEFYRILRNEGTVYSFEEEMYKRDGNILVVLESARIVKDNEGKELYIEGIVEDITERKKFEVQLIEARNQAVASNRIKSEFLAQMSHEIRTPINSILNFIELIKDEVLSYLDEEHLSFFHMIKTSSDRIIRTIDLILNMSELQTGAYEVFFKSLNIFKDIFPLLQEEYEMIAKEKGIEFIIHKRNDIPLIIADEYSVTQIFLNLVDNAVKYTEHGKVEVKVEGLKNNLLSVVIEDTGIGISKEYFPKLFEEFSQEEHGYSRKYEGNGLGLALVKKYCELNGAKILVESEKGKGSKFTVIFKCQDYSG